MDRLTGNAVSWAPSRAVFLRRVGLNTAVTFVALLGAALLFSVTFDLPMGWGVLVAAILSIGFVIEDLARWRSTRNDRWQINGGFLIHDGPEGRAQIPLSQIASVQAQFGNRVIVKLGSGQRIAMRYLPFAAATASQIEAARAPEQP